MHGTLRRRTGRLRACADDDRLAGVDQLLGGGVAEAAVCAGHQHPAIVRHDGSAGPALPHCCTIADSTSYI